MDEFPTKRIRISIKYENPNPLFESWLLEFISQAEKKESKSLYQLRKALSSLKKYPLPLHTGRDCIILEGFGKDICNLLDKKLEEHIRLQLRECQQEVPVDSNIVQLSESFQASEPYQKRQQEEDLQIINKVTEELQKEGLIQSPKVVSRGRKPKCGSKNTVASTQRTQFQTYKLQPGEYKIILLVDTCETMG